jgi:hypothetical protein
MPEPRAWFFVPLLLLTLGLSAAMLAVDQPLRAAGLANGIVSLELAGTVPAMQAMLAGFDAYTRFFAGVSLGLDFLYLLAYSTTMALACAWAGAIFRARGLALAAFGVPLAYGQWVAGLCDGIENVALIVALGRGVRAPWPAIASWFAVVKFALLAAGLAYVLAGALARLRGGGRRELAAR